MKKKRWIVGVDEAGRGPLAGPVYVGVFAIPENISNVVPRDVQDSKVLSEKRRNMLFEKLINIPNTRYAVAYTEPKTIDTQGINPAVYVAVQRALKKLKIAPHHCTVLLDGGLRAPKIYETQKAIIKGDRDVPVISAASILAKVSRDRKMYALAKQYASYNFEQHKGYGTKLHREKILKKGLSKVHRRSFCRNIISNKTCTK